MDARISRRHLLYAGAAAGAAIWLPDSARLADAAPKKKVPLARGGTFSTGVMSGDPAPEAVTLWSRLDGQEAARQRVRLELAKDADFKNVVLRRDVPITALRDHTCKIRVGGLKPDERYFFRFATRTTSSDVGRTQTAPAADSQRPIKVGYFSCQDFSSGHYGVYKKLLELDPDVVLCGGDYIYDRIYSESGYGGIREDKAGSGPDSVALTIDHYRAKYRLYRTDPDLRELHRLVPSIIQWDDHEVTDNYVGTLDKSGADDGEAADVYDRNRTLSGWRAWHEYMPAIRFEKGYRTYRSLRFGKSMELFMLDSRTYRVDQACPGAFTRCSGADAPNRPYLGAEQLSWLKQGLGSDATWKVVGNQLMIMPFMVAADVQVEADSWNGYRAERSDLLGHVESKQLKDIVFLTGDIHTFFAGEVRRNGQSGAALATEFVGGSTTSPGTAEVIGRTAGGAPPELAQALTDPGVPANNPWIQYAETRAHGCAFVEVGPSEVRARYLASRDVKTLAGSRDVRTIADLKVARGVAGVQ